MLSVPHCLSCRALFCNTRAVDWSSVAMIGNCLLLLERVPHTSRVRRVQGADGASVTKSSGAQAPIVGLPGFKLLCSPQWLPTVASHLRGCLEGELRRTHAPAFIAALAQCAQCADDADTLEATLIAALRQLVQRVTEHLAIIDAVVSACRAHCAVDVNASSLERVVSVRSGYLGCAAAMLQPGAAGVDGGSLQQV